MEGLAGGAIEQHVIDIFAPTSYRDLLAGHDTAICTLGVETLQWDDFMRLSRDVS
jgi:hypothetical protein